MVQNRCRVVVQACKRREASQLTQRRRLQSEDRHLEVCILFSVVLDVLQIYGHGQLHEYGVTCARTCAHRNGLCSLLLTQVELASTLKQ